MICLSDFGFYLSLHQYQSKTVSIMGNRGTKKPRSNELTPKEILLLKANTQYSEKQIRDSHAKFLRDCPNGKLNKIQFVEMYKKYLKQDKAEAFCKLAFSAFDTNHDGSIDFDEFLLCIAAMSQADLNQRLEVVFDICDSSDDGQIDRNELANMIAVMVWI